MDIADKALRDLNSIVRKYDKENLKKRYIKWSFEMNHIRRHKYVLIDTIMALYNADSIVKRELDKEALERIRNRVTKDIKEWERHYRSLRVALEL